MSSSSSVSADSAAESCQAGAQVQHRLVLSDKQASGFIAFYKSLPPPAGNGDRPVVRFFDRKNFYTVHGDDATMISSEYYKTTVGVNSMGAGSNTLTSFSVNPRAFDEIVPDLLLRRGMAVEVWAASGKVGGWECSRKGSPGHLDSFEDLVLGVSGGCDTGVVASVKILSASNQKMVGFAFVNTTQRILGVAEFLENDQYSNLESALLQNGVKECLICFDHATMDVKKVKDVLMRCDVSPVERKRADFNPKDADQDLGRLLEDIKAAAAELDMTNAIGALMPAITYLDLLRDESNFGQFKMMRFDLSNFVRLDVAAVRALNLFPSPNDSNKFMNLYGLLNRCKTAMGSRMLAQWIRQPLIDHVRIAERADLVELMINDSVFRQIVREEHLSKIPDLQRIIKKLQRSRGRLEDLARLYQVALRVPLLAEVIQDAVKNLREVSVDVQTAQCLENRFLLPLQQAAEDFGGFLGLVENVMDVEAMARHEYMVKAEFDSRLQELKQEKDRIEEDIKTCYHELLRSFDLSTQDCKLDSNLKLGFHLRVPKKKERVVRNKKQSDIVSETSQNMTRFTNAKLRNLNGKFAAANSMYEEHQAELVQKAISIAASYIPVLEGVCGLLSELDVLCSFAEASMNAPIPYVRPEVLPMGSGVVEIKDGRHPCLEVQEMLTFIPNDVEMRQGVSNFIIVSGPNMGGKSTYIRSIGVIALMAQIGCFVPCSAATITAVDCISARVGASDSQLRGISTFMYEMLETSAILQSATKDSLIIVDELGRGTSTYDGYGLAYSISDYISRKLGSYCLFATHFHELTSLEGEAPGVVNRHVTAHTQGNTLTMLYKIQPGPCDQSFGIHVAELAGFPQSVLRMAKRKAAELEDFQHSHDGTEGDGQPPTKRPCHLDAEGERVVNDFLNEFCELPLGTLSAQETRVRLQAMTKKVQASHNPSVMELLKAAAGGGEDAAISIPMEL